MLIEGVKIQVYDKLFEDRISKSNGIKKLINDSAYHPISFIPNTPWSTLNKDEISKLISLNSNNLDYKSNISIIKIPNNIILFLEELKLSNIDSYDSLNKIMHENSEKYFDAFFALDKYFHQYLINDKHLHKLGIHIGLPQLESATISNNKYVGLHIDSWDNLPIAQIDNCTNRISINLGKEDRFLLFVNLTVRQIYEVIKSKSDKTFEEYDVNTLAEDFLALNSQYPVIKLKLKPYEAYIAPTENLIHDGCTIGKLSMDITLTTRGYFKLSL